MMAQTAICVNATNRPASTPQIDLRQRHKSLRSIAQWRYPAQPNGFSRTSCRLITAALWTRNRNIIPLPWDDEKILISPPDSLSNHIVRGLSIVLIDLVLAGDNALVIAMAVRGLPQKQRKIAIAWGAAAAVILRVGITIVAARLLSIEFIQLLGGALVLWIAVKVIADADSPPDAKPPQGTLLKAIWLIVFADITMSIDNILAVAGAAHGSIFLIVFGLCVSIPFVVFASNLIATLMDRHPVIVYLGVAILGYVGAEMMMTDHFIARTLQPSQAVRWIAEAIAIVAILVIGKLICHRRRAAS
jgi:YjbE family integral membrane protein